MSVYPQGVRVKLACLTVILVLCVAVYNLRPSLYADVFMEVDQATQLQMSSSLQRSPQGQSQRHGQGQTSTNTKRQKSQHDDNDGGNKDNIVITATSIIDIIVLLASALA